MLSASSQPSLQRALALGLLAVAALNGIVLNLVLQLVFHLPTTLQTSLAGIFAAGFSRDSWNVMFRAVRALGESDATVYQTLFFEQGFKFQYPPTALLPIEVLHQLSALDPRFMSFTVMNILSWPLFAGTIVLSGIILVVACRTWLKIDFCDHPNELKILALAVLILGVTFYPLVRSYSLGQAQTWIDCLVAALLLAWLAGRRALSGALAGLCCLIKPQFGVLLVWALLRRQWRFAAGGLAAALPLVALSLALYGLDDHLDYLRVLSFISQHGEAYAPNQSVNGLLNRLLHNGSNLIWEPHLYAPYNRFVHLATLVTSALILGCALVWRGDRDERAGAIDLCLVLLSLTMASPVAWEHHYGILLPIFALILPATLATPELGPHRIAVVAGAFLLTSNLFAFTNRFADGPFDLLQSYLFFGALVLLAHLYRLRRAVALRRAGTE